MQSDNSGPQERTHGQETAQTELSFKPMDGIREGLKKGDNFTDDQAAAITMAMNDAIQLALNKFDALGQRFDDVVTNVNEVQNELKDVRKDLRSGLRGLVWPIVVSVLLGAIGIMATIHWS